MYKRLGNLEVKKEELKSALEAGFIDEETYQLSVKELEKEYLESKSSSQNTNKNDTTSNKGSSKSASKKERKTKKKSTTNNQSNAKDDFTCDDAFEEVKRLREQLAKAKQGTTQKASKKSKSTKVKAVPTRKEKEKQGGEDNAEKPATSETKQSKNKSGSRTSKGSTKKGSSKKDSTKPTNEQPNAENVETKAQAKEKAKKEKETTKKEAQKRNIKVQEGEAVRQFSVIRMYANRFKGLLGKSIEAGDKRIINFKKKIKLDNEVGRFSAMKSPQGLVALQMYKYLLNYKGGNFGDAMAQADIDLIKEVAKSEYLPLTITYIKRYINLSANPKATKEKQDELLKLMNNAKKREAIKTTDISYKEFEKYRKNLENGKLEFDEELKGLVGRLSGFVSGLQGLGTIEEYQEKKSNEVDDDIDYSTPPPMMTTSEMLQRGSEIYEFTGKFRELMGEPGRGFDVMIYGRPGNGKSTLALQLSQYLGERYGDVLYVSSEQYDTPSLKQNLTMNGIDSDYIHWVEALNSKDVSKYQFVVIDSINNLDVDIETFKELKAKNRLTSFILIFQVTKDGNFKGSQEWEHEVDISINVEQGEANIQKNRFAGEELGSIPVWNGKKKKSKCKSKIFRLSKSLNGKKEHYFYTDCVSANSNLISEMVDKSKKITLKSFLNNVNMSLEELNDFLGYNNGGHLRIQNDYHVKYFKSKYDGESAYFVVHSGVEYVFLK